LHNASWKGHPDIVQALLEKGLTLTFIYATLMFDSYP